MFHNKGQRGKTTSINPAKQGRSIFDERNGRFLSREFLVWPLQQMDLFDAQQKKERKFEMSKNLKTLRFLWCQHYFRESRFKVKPSPMNAIFS